MKQTYRGYEIERRSNGKWYILDPDGELSYLKGPYTTEEEAYKGVDVHKRMTGAKGA